MKRPKCFKTQVDPRKVNLRILRTWISETLQEELPDDDIVVDYLCEMLEDPKIEDITEQMAGFLGEEKAVKFCKKLWNMMISAQDDPDGIPTQLLEKRKQEMDLKEENKVDIDKKTNYNRAEHAQSNQKVQSSEGERDDYNRKSRLGKYNRSGSRPSSHSSQYNRSDSRSRPSSIRSQYNANRRGRSDERSRSRSRSPSRER